MKLSISQIDEETSRFRIARTRDEDDTLDLRYGVSFAGTGEPENYLVFLNGRTEWLEKYSYLPATLGIGKRTAFLTWDHRGQGDSGGARSFVDSYDSFARDAARIIEQVTCGRPYAVLSHSMGGLIALYATLTGRIAPKALVLASPLLGMPNEPVPRPIAAPLASLLTRLHLGAVSTGAGSYTKCSFPRNKLTHHPELYRRMRDTSYKIPGATFSWVSATFRAIAVCHSPEYLARLTVPTLVIGGSDERVVDAEAFRTWVQTASGHAAAEVQLRMIAGGRHELFSEVPEYYDPAVTAAASWINARMPMG